jgi:hypothetical protein
MKIFVTMDLHKECKHSYRYDAADAVITSLYIRKEALKQGEKAPKSINVAVNGLEI